jgi:hypothetical protein
MADLGPTTAQSDQRDDSAPELWQRASRDAAREARLLAELVEQGLTVATHGAALQALCGVAASLDPSSGDPQLVAVVPDGESEAFLVDRRTMRIQEWPRTSLAREDDVVLAADLADRAQLALGEPVLVRFGQHEGRLAVEAVRPLEARLSFTNASYRKLSSLASGSGTLAPLSVDAIDRALRLEQDHGDEPRVRRIFARAYRRIDAHHTPWSERGREALRALGSLARLGRDVALSLADARRFRSELSAALGKHDSVDLSRLDRADLVDALRARMALVTGALVLLERARLATLSLLPALEALCGVLSRELIDTLADPQRTPERRAVEVRLREMGARCRELPPRGHAEVGSEWQALRRTLRHLRVLGMDVRPDVMGSDDAHLAAAIQEAVEHDREASDAARRSAERTVMQQAARGPLGPLAVAPAGGLVVLIGRLSQAKGAVAEGLSAALLRLRAAGLEAGRRLAQEGILERADDALYMPLDEIEEALEGELGAYAARVRLRREDDRRWRNYRAPRFLMGRRG